MPVKMLDTSMADIITKMEQVSTEDMRRGHYYVSGNYHEPLPYRESLLGMLESMKKRTCICIDCVRSIDATEF
jgi:hypothetical protein